MTDTTNETTAETTAPEIVPTPPPPATVNGFSPGDAILAMSASHHVMISSIKEFVKRGPVDVAIILMPDGAIAECPASELIRADRAGVARFTANMQGGIANLRAIIQRLEDQIRLLDSIRMILGE